MPLKSEVITVADTATQLAESPRRGLDDVHWVEVVVPANGATVYIGGADVNTTNGRPLTPTSTAEASWSATLGPEDVLYGIVASSTQDVHVLRSRKPN